MQVCVSTRQVGVDLLPRITSSKLLCSLLTHTRGVPHPPNTRVLDGHTRTGTTRWLGRVRPETWRVFSQAGMELPGNLNSSVSCP